jgi:serine/threonine-protein kinase RsbW
LLHVRSAVTLSGGSAVKSETTSSGAADRAVTRVTFRLAACLAHRSLAIDLVSTLVEHVSTADRGFRNAITTAFGEAFNNVVIHSYRNRTDGMLDVEAELSSDHMTLKLMDDGLQADLTKVSPPNLDTLPEGGLGIFMMQALVDEVVYNSGTPNVLSLTKRPTTPASADATPPGSGSGPSRESASK